MWEILTGEEPYANLHCGAIIGKLLRDGTLTNLMPNHGILRVGLQLQLCFDDKTLLYTVNSTKLHSHTIKHFNISILTRT